MTGGLARFSGELVEVSGLRVYKGFFFGSRNWWV